MKRSEMITKKDFVIAWEWQRGMLQGQENYGYYVITSKCKGIRLADGFSSKRSAEAWLGKQIKLANKIKSGEIWKDENGKWHQTKTTA